MKKKSVSFIEYIILFFGFAAMSLLEIPTSDIFFFTHDYENSIGSFISSSLNYGNGRFLGNALGFAFSHWFTYAFIVVAVTMTLLVFVINKYFFDGDCRTVMPIALLLAFPSAGMFSEVYTSIPTFVNYVLPMVVIFAALCLIKTEKNICAIPVFLLTFISCLFCENNTISVFTLSVLAAVFSYIKSKKIKTLNISFLAGAVLGGLTMMLIPHLTGASGKLDFYRNTASSIPTMITLAIASFSTFTEIFSEFVFPIIILSVSFIYLLKKRGTGSKQQKMVVAYLAFFPVETVLYSMFSDSAPATIYLYIIQAGFVILYALALFIGILCLKKSDFKNLLVELLILMLSAVGPMLFVDKYSYRTFYLSYIIILSISLLVLKEAIKELPENAAEKLLNVANRTVIFVTSLTFICLTVSVFFQSVYNYNFYVARTQHIANKLSTSAVEVEVPELPCRAISAEDENPTLVGTILYKQNSKLEVTLSESIYCENADEYYQILNTNPISNTVTALQHMNFKSGLIIDELTE